MSAIAEQAAAVPAHALREQVATIERAFLQLPQVEIRTEHRFIGGMYVREITIPAGVFATGALHLSDHVSIMVRGRMAVMTGAGMQEVAGYNLWTPIAGIKRVGYAFEETVWLTVHRTDAKTVDQAEAELFADADLLLSRRLDALPAEQRAHLEAPCPHS